MAGDTTTLGPEADKSAEALAEAEALKALIPHFENPSYIPLSNLVAAHLLQFDQTLETLGSKVGKSESWLSQLLALRNLPTDVLQQAERDRLGFRELQDLVRQYRKAAKDSAKPAEDAKDAEFSENNQRSAAKDEIISKTPDPLGAKDAEEGIVSGNNEPGGANRSAKEIISGPPGAKDSAKESASLLKRSVDGFVITLIPWAKEARWGDIAQESAARFKKWFILRTVLAVVVLGMAAYGGIRFIADLPRVSTWVKSLFSSPTQALLAGLGFPAPGHVQSRLVRGHKLELRWTPPAACLTQKCTYSVYWTDPSGAPIESLGKAVATAGAVVNVDYRLRPLGYVSVKANFPDRTESAASEKIPFEATPDNHGDDVQPLPVEGTAVPAAPSLPAGQAGSKRQAPGNTSAPLPRARSLEPGAVLTPPTGVHVLVKTPNLIEITWQPVSKDARYNLYSSGTNPMTRLRKENDKPLKMNVVTWTPETSLERYWVVVTAIDDQGRESPYSEAVEVIRYPERAPSNAADEAAGVLRKILPW